MFTLPSHSQRLHLARRMVLVYIHACHTQVNAIGPGYFVTDLTQVLLDRADFNKFVVTRTPAGYWGVPEDQGAVIFLASPASNYVSGHNLMVDGGMSTSAADSLLPLLPDQQIANGRA